MRLRDDRTGMTLIEILMVVSIIGLLAVCLIPALRHSMRQRANLEAATCLRTALSAFEMIASEQGAYPPDKTPGVIPPEMSAYYFPYFGIDWWTDKTPLGGFWDWDNGYHYPFSVSIHDPERAVEEMAVFDALIDDGDLETGLFRRHGIHYHYILEE